MDSNQKRKDTKKMRGAASSINTPIPLNTCAPPPETLDAIAPGASPAVISAYGLFVEACKLQPSGAAGAQQLARTQSQALRRAWKEFIKFNLWEEKKEEEEEEQTSTGAGARAAYNATARHLVRCILTGTTVPACTPLSGMAVSAARQYLSAGVKENTDPTTATATALPGLEAELSSEVASFVAHRLSAAELERGFDASSGAMAALLSALEVPELARLFGPHAAAVLAFINGFVQRYPLGSSSSNGGCGAAAEHRVVQASSNALKAFVDAAARLPHELSELIPCGSGAIALAALGYMADRSLTKEFLSAAGIAFATIAAARALRANGATEDDADLQGIAATLMAGLLGRDAPNVAAAAAASASAEAADATVAEATGVVFASAEERAAQGRLGALGALAVLRGLTVSKFVAEALPGLLLEPVFVGQRQEMALISDALLPAAVAACEGATEQYPLFFSLQTLDECLGLLLGAARMRGVRLRAAAREKVAEYLRTRVVEVVWKHQGSTVPAICAQLRNVFSSLLELFAALVPQGSDGWDAFLNTVAARLLALSWRTKGKYAPLTVLLRLVPAARMVEIEPNLFEGIVDAMACHVVHSAAHNFFVALVASLHPTPAATPAALQDEEKKKKKEKEVEDEREFVRRLVRAIVARASPETTWRILVEDAASALLRVLPHALGTLIACAAEEAGEGFNDTARLLFLLCVLNFAKKHDIVPDPRELRRIVAENAGEEYQALVRRGLVHPDEAVFIESLELICLSPRVTDTPADDDLAALREFIVTNSAHSTLNSRQKMFGPLCKFFDRVRAALHRYAAAKDAASAVPPPEKKAPANSSRNSDLKKKKNKKKEEEDKSKKSKDGESSSSAVVTEEMRNKLIGFLNWTADELAALMYPGASQDRVMFGLTAYKALCSVSKELKRLGVEILTAAHAESLLSCMWLTMDKARQLTHEIFTTWCDSARNIDGLPGFNDAESVEGAIRWGLRLAHSPKMHHSDAGGRMLSFVLARLLSDTIWKARLTVVDNNNNNNNSNTSATVVPIAVSVTRLEKPNKALDAAYDFVRDLTKILAAHTEVARRDILLASTRCPMHGILAAIRYCIRQVPFAEIAKEDNVNDDAAAVAEKKRWHDLLADAMEAARAAYKVVLPIVADLAPEGYDPAHSKSKSKKDDSSDDGGEKKKKKKKEGVTEQVSEKISMIQAVQMPPMDQISAADPDGDGDGDDDSGAAMVSGDEISGPDTQLIMVCSWLTIKEVSFFLSAVHEVVPLPQSDADADTGLLTLAQVRETGQLFLELLLSTRHKGAIEKGYEGFRALCVHVLKSKSAAVRALAGEWVRETIGILYDPVSQQITRRSAGIPYCLLAVLNADLTGSRLSCAMLDATMQELLELSAGAKGYSPQVHAFNIVGSFVNQKAVSSHVDAYLDRILVSILEGYTSPDWSVRNSATIAFNIVVKRRVATSNFAEFFARFPQLYKHMLAHIGTMCQAGSSDKLQSSLFAVLTLLSRLHPSVSLSASAAAAAAATTATSPSEGDNEEEASIAASPSKLPELSFVPEPFIPHVRSCAAQPTFKIREAAAFALVPLVRPERIAATLLDLCEALPTQGSKAQPSNFVHGTLLQLEKLLKHGIAQMGAAAVTPALVKSLSERLWLAAAPCSPIGLIMLKVIRALLGVIPFTSTDSNSNGTGNDTSSFWPQALCAARAALEFHAAGVYDGTRPMDALRAEAAADMCTAAALQGPAFYEAATGEPAADLIERCLCCCACGKGGDLYEVRAACAHALRDHLRSAKKEVGPAANSGIDIGRVRTVLCRRLLLLPPLSGDNEKHRYCVKLVLETLTLLGVVDGSADSALLGQLWARSEELMENDLLRPAGLVFLGAVAREWPGGKPPRWAALAEACRRCSEPAAVVSDRLAVVEALRLVLANPSAAPEVACDAWDCLIALVQDDSFDVRQAAGEVISALLHLKSFVSPPLALEHAVNARAALPGKETSVQQHQKQQQEMDSDAFIESLGKSHLFEVEPDNGYIEEATLLQLRLQQTTGSGSNTTTAALDALAASAASLRKVFDQAQQRSNGWPRWLTYDRTIFVPLYRRCLNAYAAVAHAEGSMSVELSQHEKDTLADAVAKLATMPLHPLLAQLVSRVVKAADKTAPAPKLMTAGDFGNIDAASFLVFQI